MPSIFDKDPTAAKPLPKEEPSAPKETIKDLVKITEVSINDDEMEIIKNKLAGKKGLKYTKELILYANEALSKESEDGYISASILKDVLFDSLEVINGKGNRTPKDVIDSLRYVSFLNGGFSKTEAWVLTFPLEAEEIRSRHPKDFDRRVKDTATQFGNRAIVVAILKAQMVPLRIIRANARLKAVDKLINIMDNPQSSLRLQMESADKILVHLGDPEEKSLKEEEMEENMGEAHVNVMNELAQMVKAQREAILGGASIQDVQKILPENKEEIIDVE